MWAASVWDFSSNTRMTLRLDADIMLVSQYGHSPAPLDMHENNEADQYSLYFLHVNTGSLVT